jgi:hypothetical protein
MGDNYSTEGNGVIGTANATTGWVNGVYGISHSPEGNGIGGANSAGGNGVHAFSTSGAALYAKTETGMIITGVDGNDSVKFSVANDGNVYADGSYQSPAADFAEMLPAQDGLEPGDVLIIGEDGELTLSTEAYQASVAGVYSTQPGFVGGARDKDLTGQVPLAVVGIVPVKVSTENGAIAPGDLLTTSDTPGYAMKADPITLNGISFYPSGVLIGKALEPLATGKGVIQLLVMLQ